MAKSTIEVTNDNSELQVVFEEGDRLRNYVMRRYETHGTVGEVDFGKKQGLWLGYAEVNDAGTKFVFHRVRQLQRALTESNNKKSG